MAEVALLDAPQSCVPHPRKRKRRKRTALIADFQDVLCKGALDPDASLSEISSASNAFCNLEGLRREILGLGKPKPVEPVNADKGRKRKTPGPISPI